MKLAQFIWYTNDDNTGRGISWMIQCWSPHNLSRHGQDAPQVRHWEFRSYRYDDLEAINPYHTQVWSTKDPSSDAQASIRVFSPRVRNLRQARCTWWVMISLARMVVHSKSWENCRHDYIYTTATWSWCPSNDYQCLQSFPSPRLWMILVSLVS